MKKILFVLQTLNSGGTATSMLNLIDFLKDRGTECDLFLLQREGCFLDRADTLAKVLPEERIISSIVCSRERLRKRGVLSYCTRIAYVLCHKMFGEEIASKWFRKASARKLNGKYNVVIAYQENATTFYAQYIKADKKIAWVHNDYCRFAVGLTKQYMQNVYDRFDEIVCVSHACLESIKDNLTISDKHIRVLYNTIPPEFIKSQAEKQTASLLKKSFTFISIGRLTEQKRFDRAVEVAKKLSDDGVDFIWYILGGGEDFVKINNRIVESKIENKLILLGVKSNPFSLLAQADCLILTSLYEAQPMVLNEALTLGIPVISTEFSSVHEVVKSEENGLIVTNSAEGVYDGINMFICSKELRKKIQAGAKSFVYDNKSIVNAVLDLINT